MPNVHESRVGETGFFPDLLAVSSAAGAPDAGASAHLARWCLLDGGEGEFQWVSTGESRLNDPNVRRSQLGTPGDGSGRSGHYPPLLRRVTSEGETCDGPGRRFAEPKRVSSHRFADLYSLCFLF